MKKPEETPKDLLLPTPGKNLESFSNIKEYNILESEEKENYIKIRKKK